MVKHQNIIYEIMHTEEPVARVSTAGEAEIMQEDFMPYDLYLEPEDENDIDIRMNNLENFYHWCASRMLTLDRQYAKAILNSIGASQAVTDRDRANIALSYHCVTLTDVFWVRKQGENARFEEINLYDHSLNDAVAAISLRGRQMTVTNRELAQDISTGGCFPKAWIREKNLFLLKGGSETAVRNELLASRICRCFAIPQVAYEPYIFENQLVSKSEIFTSKRYSIVTKMAFDIYALNHDLDTLEMCKTLDPIAYYGMNILDYLVGNTDRHPENWGFLVDNRTNRCVSLHPLMDFNQSFLSYDAPDGANCLTVFPARMTQREVAVEAVSRIGLRQVREVDVSWFGGRVEEAQMFMWRLEELKKDTIT
ncbi:MAG: hypothetical protein LUE29_14255 [Lachnospiraceae bacterium]|nr:hypothetical protein [Lachnospiraceae bacterium]